MSSLVDQHPQRDKIIESILSGVTLREIGRRYNLGPMVLHRYRKNVVKPAVMNAPKLLERKPELAEPVQQIQTALADTKAAAAAAPVLKKLLSRDERRALMFEQAIKKKDLKGFAALDTCEHRDIRLEAELTGALQGATASTSQINIMIIAPSSGQPIAADDAGEIIDITQK